MPIDRLLSIASSALVPAGEVPASPIRKMPDEGRFRELHEMLSLRNGFYAYEAALHVFPWTADLRSWGGSLGVQAWNERRLWRDWYAGLIDDLFFFAEDVFGGQFAIRGAEIVSFDPESGEIERTADSLADWAHEILSSYAQLTGYPAGHAWQLIHGPIPSGMRLLPKTPFILGGSYDEPNLFAVDAVKGMRYRGELWQQIRDLPDGARVRLKPLPLQ